MKTRLYKMLIPIMVTSLFFFFSAPAGLSLAAWHLFGIFSGTIFALIFQPFPEPTMLIIAVTLASIFIVPLQEILIGYADGMLWLTVAAIMISIGLKKSGLTRRIGLILISKFGKTLLHIGYIVSFIDLLLATSTPASPARTGGLVYPLAEGVIDTCKSTSVLSQRKIGGYFTLLAYMTSMTTGSLFMTGMGPNLINVKMASDVLGISVSWPLWVIGALPGFVVFLLIPYIIYIIYKPESVSMDEARQRASIELKAAGKFSRNEIIVTGVFLLLLLLWSTSTITKLDTTMVAFIGISLILVFEVIEWEDLVGNKEMWSLLMWFGAILGLSAALTKLGFFSWFAVFLKAVLPTAGLSTYTILILLAMLAIFPHYFFVSFTGYVVAFSPMIFSFVAATDIPRYPAFFLIAYLMVVSCSVTHYGNALGPFLMGKGYNDKKIWWSTGLLITIMHAILYLTIGAMYWNLIGLWY